MWASDIWITYARLSKQAALRVSAVVGSTSFEDAEQGAFNGEELGMASMETAALGHAHFAVDGDDDYYSSDDMIRCGTTSFTVVFAGLLVGVQRAAWGCGRPLGEQAALQHGDAHPHVHMRTLSPLPH